MKLLIMLGFITFSSFASAQVKLYTIDCGRVFAKDFGLFADTGDFDKVAVEAPSPCFLITHPKGNFMWDMGINKDSDAGFGKLVGSPSLVDNLKKINLTPKDIGLISFSHLHLDHIGNAPLFSGSTWILNPEEYKHATNLMGEADLIKGYKKAKKINITGDHDVFGDGTVRIIKAPGHSHAHQVLLLTLKSGKVILSGDLYHQRLSLEKRLVPGFNLSRADTLASMERIEGIIRFHKARLIIQHDNQDIKSLPVFPNYLE